MKLTNYPHSDDLIIVLASRDILEALWMLNTEQYLNRFDSPPCASWFTFEAGYPHTFHVSDCKINEDKGIQYLKFSNGRHRTRWLIDCTDLDLIPIGLRKNDLHIATEVGLLCRIPEQDEELDMIWAPTFIDFSRFIYR